MKKWIIILYALIIFTPLASQPTQKELILDTFGGLSLEKNPYLIHPNRCVVKENCDTDEGGIKTRDGYQLRIGPNTTKTYIKLFVLKETNGKESIILQAEDELWATAISSPTSTADWIRIKQGISWKRNPLRAATYDNKKIFTNAVDDVFYWASEMSTDSCVSLSFIPKGNDIETHNKRIYIGGIDGNQTTVFYSEESADITEEANWPVLNFMILEYKEGDYITALKSYREALYIFGTETTWGHFGDKPSIWEYIKISDYYGCIYKEQIQILREFMILLTNRGMALFDGRKFDTIINSNIRSRIKESNTFKGQNNFWNITTTDDFEDGTLNNIDSSGNEMKLEDKTYRWESFTLAMGTATNTKTVSGNIVLTSTYSYSVAESTISYTLLSKIDRRYTSHDLSIASRQNIEFIENNTTHWGTRNSPYVTNYINDEDFSTGASLEEEDYEEDGGGTMTNWIDQKYADTFLSIYKYDLTFPLENIVSIRIKTDIKLKQRTTFSGEIKAILRLRTRNNIGSTTVICDKIIHEFEEWYKSVGTEQIYAYDETFNIDNRQLDRVYVDIMFVPTDLQWDIPSAHKCFVSPFFEILLKGRDITATSLVHDTPGTFLTNWYDPEENVLFSTITVQAFAPTHSTITYSMHSSFDQSKWSTMTFTNYQMTDNIVGKSYAISISSGRYYRLQMQLKTDLSTDTYTQPDISWVEIAGIVSTGSFLSDGFYTGTIGEWGYAVMKDSAHKQTILYSTRTATTESGLTSKSTGIITSGDIISAPITDNWIQYYIELKSSTGTENPTVQSITTLWSPEVAGVVPSSIVIDDQYWMGISTPGYTYNHLTMVLDRNLEWGDYLNIHPASFVKFRNDDFMVDSDINKLYILNKGTVDRGTAPIGVNYKWKKFDFQEPNIDKHYESIYATLQKGTGTVNFNYRIGDSTTTFTQSIPQAGTGILNQKVPIPEGLGTAMTTFQPAISSTNTVNFFKLGIYYNEEQLK